MNQHITNWFTPTSTSTKSKRKRNSICLISTNSNSQNNQIAKNSRKRKRSQTDFNHQNSHHTDNLNTNTNDNETADINDNDNKEDDNENNTVKTPFTQSSKRRKLSKKTTSCQKNNLLSFLTPKLQKNKHENSAPNDDNNNNNKDIDIDIDNDNDIPIIDLCSNKKNDENKSDNVSISRYGRKRKKINYNLASYWGLNINSNEEKTASQSSSTNQEEEHQNNSSSDDYECDEDEDEDEDDEEYIIEDKPNKKRKRKIKKDNKRKKCKTKTKTKTLNVEQEKEKAETFFMSKSEKNQYKRDKVMIKFQTELAKRHSEDQRLFGGKKANPYFEIAKKRQKLLNNAYAKNDNDYKSNNCSIHFNASLFPKISSIKPFNDNDNENDNENETDFKVKCIDLMENEFNFEMNKIEKQMSDLLYSPTITLTIDVDDDNGHDIDIHEGNVNVTDCDITTPRYTYYWPSQPSLDKYFLSAQFNDMISQISREFPSIAHNVINNELVMCLNRSTQTDDNNNNNDPANAMWCDKYKPYSAVEVVGNWMVANELQKWLKAWTNKEEKQSYLLGPIMPTDMYNDSECSDSDGDWLPLSDSNNNLEIELSIANTVLLTGPTACGKTTSINAVAKQLNYNVIEVNCIMVKTAKDLNDLFGEATQSQQVDIKSQAQSIILLEEVDNMLQSAPCIIKTITNFLNNSRCPIILTAQNIPKSLKHLNLTNFQFGYGSLERLSLRTYIIALCEGICLTRHEIEKIVMFFDYDLRSVLINLQFWLTSPRTFDHFNDFNNNNIPLPLPNTANAIATNEKNTFHTKLALKVYSLPHIKNTMKSMHKLSIYQRIVGFADISYNSCNGKDELFWSHFVNKNKNKEVNINEKDLNDNLYCFVQHILESGYINNIIFNSFPYWFVNDINSIQIYPKPTSKTSSSSSLAQLFNKKVSKATNLHSNCNPFTFSWTQNKAIVQAKNIINSLLDTVCGSGCNQLQIKDVDIEMKQLETEKKIAIANNSNYNASGWLSDWCTMIDTLSDHDILEKPHGCTLNGSYHYRLHPHTTAIFDEPLDISWECCKMEEYDNEEDDNQLCQIYDTIQHEYLRHYISPYLVTSAIKIGGNNIDNELIKFEPKLIDDLIDKQISNTDRYNIAESFRRHPVEGNFDVPTSKAWFDFYHEFISTVCINEYHRKKKGGSQYRLGMELRRSRRNITFFQHILEGWLTSDQSQQIVESWKFKFDGMGWKKNTLPAL